MATLDQDYDIAVVLDADNDGTRFLAKLMAFEMILSRFKGIEQ
jgi:hypothetical protein